MKKAPTRSRPPRGRGAKKDNPSVLNQATVADFEEKGLGVAPKE